MKTTSTARCLCSKTNHIKHILIEQRRYLNFSQKTQSFIESKSSNKLSTSSCSSTALSSTAISSFLTPFFNTILHFSLLFRIYKPYAYYFPVAKFPKHLYILAHNK